MDMWGRLQAGADALLGALGSSAPVTTAQSTHGL
jgi:hypothetical protein